MSPLWLEEERERMKWGSYEHPLQQNHNSSSGRMNEDERYRNSPSKQWTSDLCFITGPTKAAVVVKCNEPWSCPGSSPGNRACDSETHAWHVQFLHINHGHVFGLGLQSSHSTTNISAYTQHAPKSQPKVEISTFQHMKPARPTGIHCLWPARWRETLSQRPNMAWP